jgi:hypothetical protein
MPTIIPDKHQHVQRGSHPPYERAVAVVPSDTTDLPFRTLALIATTTAGTVVVRMKDQTTSVTLYLALGVPLAVRVDRVLTGGSAAGILALD